PPDLFSATGQLGGNPLYRWDVMEKDGYSWWVERFRRALRLCDIVRVDHFRGFQAGWQVPASESTAVRGRWVEGPGDALFARVLAEMNELPIIVEDLGIITREVDELRERLGYPGMKVLQFAFGGDSDNPYLPHKYERNSVVYTGTHDNDTTIGWYDRANDHEREHVNRYLGGRVTNMSWELIRLAMSSVSSLCIVPMQDILELDSSSRMNTPGTITGNWRWRLEPRAVQEHHARLLADLTALYGRDPRTAKPRWS
ncbi:MAG: 4-alpha-glucanotransferase, partial [Planctomycetes bacterium]|nr:4-alpha-glucanotransferase [Planctomycetota bacterium]